jgi:hypothetical protein
MTKGVTSVIKWDGEKWNYHSWPEGGANGIWGFSENNIFIVGEYSNRGFIGHYDGIRWTEYRSEYFLSRGDTVYPLRAVWGSAPDDIWAVGDFGTIIHWNGGEWKKESIDINLKEFDFLDIWGYSKDNIYISGRMYQQKVVLLKYDGIKWNTIIENSNSSVFSTTWGPHEQKQYLITQKKYIIVNNVITTFVLPNQTAVISKIRGSASNNIFTVGHFGEIFHFNGIAWQRIELANDLLKSSALTGCFTTEKNSFFIGYTPSVGVISVRGTFIKK